MEVLQYILFICYQVLLKQELIKALIDSNSEINTITLVYAKKFGLQVQKTDVGAQKIDCITLVINNIVVTNFSL